jgi:hypothetical protein
METKFKIGDRVRLIGCCSANNNKVGDIGIVTEISDSELSFRVTVAGNPDFANWSGANELVAHRAMRVNDLKPHHKASLLKQVSQNESFGYVLYCIDNNIGVFGTMPLDKTKEGFDYWSNIVDEFNSGKYAK